MQDRIVDRQSEGQVRVVASLTLEMGDAITFLLRTNQENFIDSHHWFDDLHRQRPFIGKAGKQLRHDLLWLLANPVLKGRIVWLAQLWLLLVFLRCLRGLRLLLKFLFPFRHTQERSSVFILLL